MPDSMQMTPESDLSGESPRFTLTCNSTGGPATTVTWTRDSEEISGGITVLDDPMTAQYTHTLTVNGRLGGLYQCNVSNSKPSTATASFYMQGKVRRQNHVTLCTCRVRRYRTSHCDTTVASVPTDLMAVQQSPTGVQVSWTPPTPLKNATGYRIYYYSGSNHSVHVNNGSTKSYLLTGLQNSASYNISIVATSEHFFSDYVIYPQPIHLGEFH